MYFNDEIILIKETETKNDFGQYSSVYERNSVFAEIKGVSSRELADAGTAGHKATGTVVIFTDDYEGEELVEITEPHPILKPGVYEVYRKYQTKDKIDLYLKEKVGLYGTD